MVIIIRIPELISPELYHNLDIFLAKKSKQLGCKIIQLTHKGSKVKVKFVDIYDHPHDWKGFLKQINSILELDKG